MSENMHISRCRCFLSFLFSYSAPKSTAVHSPVLREAEWTRRPTAFFLTAKAREWLFHYQIQLPWFSIRHRASRWGTPIWEVTYFGSKLTGFEQASYGAAQKTVTFPWKLSFSAHDNWFVLRSHTGVEWMRRTSDVASQSWDMDLVLGSRMLNCIERGEKTADAKT